jgi:hypothetical protein
MSNIIKATHEGKLILGESELNVAVLEDGTRVISRNAIFKAFGRTKRGRAKTEQRVPNMPSFIDANNLQPFLGEDLRGGLKQLDFLDLNGKQDSAYDALILPMLCKVYLDARQSKALKTQQLPLARASEILLVSLSKVGIIAMVDEVTGFQEERDKNALQEFLSKFINEQRGVYIPTYPDEFFEALFKMRGLNWSLASKGKKPQYFGHLLNNFVYERIGPKVLEALRKVNPKDEITGKRKGKHTQHIDDKYGHPKLKEHLIILTAFAKAAGYNWNTWERMVNKALPKFEKDGSQIQELDF